MRFLAAVIAATITLTLAASAHAAADVEAVAALNQMRAQIGVAPVTLDPAMSAGCAKHVAYMRATGEVHHYELPTEPSYSPEGATAAAASVLAWGNADFRTPETNPWGIEAPLHMLPLLRPQLRATGYADGGGYACMDVDGSNDPTIAGDQTFTWPANEQTGVPYETSTETETPNPALYFGWKDDHISGPYLLVYAQGYGGIADCGKYLETPPAYWQDGTTFSNVSLVGPDGPVEVKYQDNNGGKLWDGICPDPRYPGDRSMSDKGPEGGYIVATNPLKPSSRYTASLTITGIGPAPQSIPYSFSFTTEAARPKDEDPEDSDPINVDPEGDGTWIATKPVAEFVRVRIRSCRAGRCVRRLVPRIRVTYKGQVWAHPRGARTTVAIRRIGPKKSLLVARSRTNANGEWRVIRHYAIPTRSRRAAIRWYSRQFPTVLATATVAGKPLSVRERLIAVS